MSVLVVQLGHCYRRTGATGTPGEQPFATLVGQACRRLLDGRGGWTVRLILADDHDPDSLRGDAFVAVHCDGATTVDAHGSSVGYRNRAGQIFGQAWKRAYYQRGWRRGFRRDNYTPELAGYYGTGDAIQAGNTRAIIIEAGFLTNPDDRAVLTAPDGPARVALAIGDALRIPTTSPAALSREDADVKFVQGNGPSPWSDYVFKVVWPDHAGPIAVRTHVPNPNDPGYRVALATGAGMDPETGKPWRVKQADLDRIPFATTGAQASFAAECQAAGHATSAPDPDDG